MKKKVLGLVLAVFVFFPMVVHAAYSGTVFGSADENMQSTTLNGGSIVCPKSADNRTATCYIGISVTSGTVDSFDVTATLTNMTYSRISMMNGWSQSAIPEQSGNTVTFKFSNRTGLAAPNRVLVAKVTYTVNNQAQECSIQLSASQTTTPTTPTETPKCRVEDKTYYCADGKECSKAEYDQECVPENPTTGSFVPYVVVLGGIGLAGALYFATRKKAKIYHV